MTTLATETKQRTPAPFSPELERPREQRDRRNVHPAERVVSAVIGGALAAYGLRRGTAGGIGLAVLGGSMIWRGASGRCLTYQALGIDTLHRPARAEDFFQQGIHVEEAMTIDRPAEELYRFWRDLENLPRFMYHLKSVKELDRNRSHWVVRAPAGTSVQWDATIINDEPGVLVAWRSLEGADVDNAGSVRFAPGPQGRGTEVRVILDYIPPAGQIGKAVAKLFGEAPDQQIREDLRRFKRLMETGEVATTTGQPRGRCSWFD